MTVDDAARLTALELREAYRRRDLSPIEVLDGATSRIEAAEPRLNAYMTLALDEARAAAQAAETAFAAGRDRPLEGIPIAVKDLFDSAGLRTTYGSAMFDDHVPAADAAAVRRARDAGAIVVGKATTDEFAYGIAGVNPHYGATRNPWAGDRVSGGSSSGSAATVAALGVPLALGSDTGGSIRVPCAFCGVVGFKGTWGTVSTAGMWPMGRTLDHAGPIARTPADAALLQGVIADRPLAAPAVAPPRVGTCPDLVPLELSADVRAALDAAIAALAGAGCEVAETRLPDAPSLLPTFVAIRDAETLDAHRRAGLYPDRRAEYGALTAERLDAAAGVGLAGYLAAAADRERLAVAFDALFDHVDVLVLPITADAPPAIDRAGPDDAAWAMVHPFTVPYNLLGVPACVVRAGFDSAGLPVGVQIVGRHGADAVVLGAAQALFDAASDVQERWPDAVV